MKPGDAELEMIHFQYDDMTEEQRRDVIGALSWKLNPQKHIDLYEDYMRDQQLYELLQTGMSPEQQIEICKKN